MIPLLSLFTASETVADFQISIGNVPTRFAVYSELNQSQTFAALNMNSEQDILQNILLQRMLVKLHNLDLFCSVFILYFSQ